MQKKPDVARQILAARDRILASSFMQDRLAQSVTDAAARRVYNAQVDATRGGEEVEARIIVVATEQDAASVVEALDQGAEFEALARSLSIERQSGERGGALGWITRDYKDAAIAATAFSTAAGTRAAPFEVAAGWCVLETTGRRRVGGVAFEDVREDVKRYLRMKAIDATLAGLREDSEVVYYPTEPARAR
ncbi:MAG: peptidyl-prolyl cis-trans isomerase [Parvularculaceae bacterium]|nr:peptidyl-prolyl cis-trans isomerase [Parvularculaceae bacterium]